MKSRIRTIVNGAFLVALTLICVLIVSNFVKPYYTDLFNESVALRIIATGDKNEEALSNNVRVSHIKVNGEELDLSKIELGPNSSWKYESRYDHISAYNLREEEALYIWLDNVHNIEITLVEELGSGIVEININDKSVKSIDLYRETGWDEECFSYDTNPFMEWDRSLKFWGLAFLAALVCWGILLKTNKVSDELAILGREMVLLWVSSLIITMVALIIQYGEYAKLLQYIERKYDVFIRTITLVFLILIFTAGLVRKLWLVFLGASAGTILLLMANEAKLANRGTPILPWDLSMAKELISVVDRYDVSASKLSVACLVLCLGIALFMFFLGPQINSIRKGPLHAFIWVGGLCMLLFKGSVFFQDIENYAGNMLYQMDTYYELQGFIPAFTDYGTQLNPFIEPDNYSRETINGICEEVAMVNTNHDRDERPTIIAVMDESFWDAERLDTVAFDEELLPNYEALKAESIYGNLFTHVLSGGTVTSEFEFLTGFSGEFFPEDYMVYGSSLDDFPSVVSLLKTQGYRTTGMHPYLAGNYNRSNAYEKLGFDECIFDHDFEDAKTVRGYISDESTFERIQQEYEQNKSSDSPQFIFAVTMQNHGGYWKEQTNWDSVVHYTTDQYGEVAKACMTDYFSGLHESDRALGELIDYFRNVDEEVVIVYFGDHMSDAGPKDDRMFEKTSWKADSFEYDYETHRVPFLVWSNYDAKSEDWGIMEVGELLPSVFERYGIRSSSFWDFLVDLRNYYSAKDNYIVINTDGTYVGVSEMKQEQINVQKIYELLQYDRLWGQNYAVDFWGVKVRE